MMERTASHQLLSSSASRVARQVFASLSYNQRLAAVYLKLAATFGQQFGMTVYATALYYGAEGMPDIKGAPASNFGPKDGESCATFVNRFLRAPVQKDYGHKFGGMFFNFCRKMMGETMAEDVVMDAMEQVLKTSSTVHHYFQTLPLAKIESTFYQAAENKFRDLKRKEKRQKTDGMPADEEGGEIDLPDRNTDPDNLPNKMMLKKLDEQLENPDIRRKVEQAAKTLGQDLDLYFKLLMDGFDPREVYDLRLLPSMQTNLPDDMKLDPSRPDPFDTANHKFRDEKGLSNKKKELLFKDELKKYPNPAYNNPTSFLNHHKALMQALQQAIESET